MRSLLLLLVLSLITFVSANLLDNLHGVIGDISASFASIPDALHFSPNFDPLKIANGLSENGIDFAKSKLDEAAASLPEAQTKIEEFKVAIDDLLKGAQSFHAIVQKHSDEKGFNIDEAAGLAAKEIERIVEGLKAEFMEPLPEDQDGWYRELDIKVSKVLDRIEDALVKVARGLGIPESEARAAFRVIKPHIKGFILIAANLARRHPILMTVVLGAVFVFLFRHVLIKPILNALGFGRFGPIKNSLASQVQKTVFGPSVLPGSWFSIMQSIAMTI